MEQKNLFTVKEECVIVACTLGLSIKMMAEHLQMNIETLRGHLKIIYAKLHIHSMGELMRYAFQNGFDRPE